MFSSSLYRPPRRRQENEDGQHSYLIVRSRFEARLTRSLRNLSRACRGHARGLVACPARLFVVAGVLFVAAALYDARDLLANALLPAVDDGLLIASVAGAMLALAAAVLWLRARRLDAAIRQLAAAIEDHGLEALPCSLVERGTPPIARLAAAINDAHRQHADRMTELLHVLAAYAHDLRTPLTRVMLRSGMLEDRALRDAMERDLAEMAELIDASLPAHGSSAAWRSRRAASTWTSCSARWSTTIATRGLPSCWTGDWTVRS